MSFNFQHNNDETIPLDDCPILVFGAKKALWLSPDGELEDLSLIVAQERLSDHLVLTVNSPKIMRQLGLSHVRVLDILELAAFVAPADHLIPSMRGLAEWLKLPFQGTDLSDTAAMIRPFTHAILDKAMVKFSNRPNRAMGGIAAYMAQADWPWGGVLVEKFGVKKPEGLMVWSRFSEWEDSGPADPPGDRAVDRDFARGRLNDLLGQGAESRPQQMAYTDQVSDNLSPRHHPDAPNVSILEAGTGTGKTLGYVAPASLWAEQNKGAVWISTFTKNLQKQIDQELNRLYPNQSEKERFAIVRKGRENYLCLLNMEEALGITALEARLPKDRILMGLVLRWLMETRDGDMVGGDFPAWIAAWFGLGRVLSLTDRRGECIYAACPHYRKCFVEKARRKTKNARLIIANHALVLHEAAAGQMGDQPFARRYVFDEGHHLFDAADSAFSIHLSGAEMVDLRRWIKGKEDRRSGRARGLKARMNELSSNIKDINPLMDDIEQAASFLASAGWLKRVHGANPINSSETFFMHVRAHVFARDAGRSGPHGLEASFAEPGQELLDAADTLRKVLDRLAAPLIKLATKLHKHLSDEVEELNSSDRGRLESLARSLASRADLVASGWIPMLEALAGDTPEGYVDWMAIDRGEGREYDVGLHRHFIDPTQPFSKVVLAEADSAIITSATLRDRAALEQSEDALEKSWRSADVRTGSQHLVLPPARHSFSSPFDYAKQTRVLIVTDVNKQSADQVAGAFRALFKASGGGALGLFTAIKRLRTIYDAIAGDLEDQHIPLYAQHIDPMDTGSLVDIFRHEKNACLLGTDALRDGVDVPGESLRLLVFDRVPWPRPNLLHRARRGYFEGRAYDEMLVRLRLKQAFGRLIRRGDDKGVFVMLDGATPSRLLDAFPAGVEVVRCGLREAIETVTSFLKTGVDGGGEVISATGLQEEQAKYHADSTPESASKIPRDDDDDPFKALDETFRVLNEDSDDVPF